MVDKARMSKSETTVSAVAPLPAEATGFLYERHHHRIFGFCLSQLGSREDAEDAVQMTFINAQRGLRRGVTPEFELAWLFTIARNVCHNTRDSAARRGRIESPRDLESLQDALPMPERGNSGVPLGDLIQALGKIPERQRHALLLREFKGLSYEEIAAELDVSVAAVETLIFRARKSAAQQLGRTKSHAALGWLLGFGRGPFGGSGAALKLTAATATVATTATLVAIPALDKRAPAVPAPPRGEGADVGRDIVVNAPMPATHTPALRGPAVIAPTQTEVAQGQVAPADAPAPPADSTSAAPTPAGPAASSTPESAATQSAPTLPSTEPPSLTVPAVTVPPPDLPAPIPPLPEVSLPEIKVEVPKVQLPLELPADPQNLLP